MSGGQPGKSDEMGKERDADATSDRVTHNPHTRPVPLVFEVGAENSTSLYSLWTRQHL